MPSDRILKARVDSRLAHQVEQWAKEHGTDVSETLRIALRRLVEERLREKRVRLALEEFEDIATTGLFDSPKGPYKAGGFQ